MPFILKGFSSILHQVNKQLQRIKDATVFGLGPVLDLDRDGAKSLMY